MDSTRPTDPPAARWQQHCLRRLHRLMELTPESAPAELTAMEGFALLEWCRMAVYADCHDAGAGTVASALVRHHARRVARPT